MTSIDWGTIAIGSSSRITIFIKNVGDVAVYLGLDSENWNPTELKNYAKLTWDYNAHELLPKEVYKATLRLEILEKCPEYTSFGFDIVIISS